MILTLIGNKVNGNKIKVFKTINIEINNDY